MRERDRKREKNPFISTDSFPKGQQEPDLDQVKLRPGTPSGSARKVTGVQALRPPSATRFL